MSYQPLLRDVTKSCLREQRPLRLSATPPYEIYDTNSCLQRNTEKRCTDNFFIGDH